MNYILFAYDTFRLSKNEDWYKLLYQGILIFLRKSFYFKHGVLFSESWQNGNDKSLSNLTYHSEILHVSFRCFSSSL